MRELKFRVWNIQEKIYEDLLDVIGISPDGEWIYFKEPDEPGAFYADTIRKNFIIEPATGLKDKNGKEIYAGDIVKRIRKTPENKSTIYQVVWDAFCAGFDLENLDCSKTDIGYLNEYVMEEDYEVIGNVHENKELLENE